ncbi:ABC transporter permease [Streptomyces profundus]|uniref:ABC transporter permease n=1 Tax=Streptomyces profundus TaxID=2867410 RepID=UPI001D16F2FB|nr:ABC transporter permease [Streptomyces sp. MA3_2.13]UED84394.1 ABC transporter permease [Streptomyces sp. MA3_2.13]
MSRTSPRVWARDLGLGVRLALAGGPSGWMRTALSTVGIALGVAVLLLATSIPQVMNGRSERSDARATIGNEVTEPAADTLRVNDVWTEYHGEQIGGREIQPEAGEDTTATPPPGLSAFPRPGEIALSPALERLLDSPDGALLVERLGQPRADTIGDEGLLGSQELYFYLGADDLVSEDRGVRIDQFGSPPSSQEEISPAVVLLILVICVVLLMPVPIFITTAVRFGGERRDRRLAALRLVGADTMMARRIAAGEAVVGAALGLVLGVLVFLALRPPLARVSAANTSTFIGDIVPSPVLAVLVLLAVPVLAVGATLFAMRSIVVEPLGVVRQSRPRPRRLVWRLVPALLGLALLLPLLGGFSGTSDLAATQAVAGVALLLTGATALLPWLVERVTGWLHGGPVSWQLAVRRLQLSNGPAVRAISGITVAVAGATALYMLFDGVRVDETEQTGADLSRAQLQVTLSQGDEATTAQVVERVDDLAGVESSLFYKEGIVGYPGDAPYAEQSVVSMVVAECSVLAEITAVTDCEDGAVFHVPPPQEWGEPTPAPGETVDLVADEEGARSWTVPDTVHEVEPVAAANGWTHYGLLVTPQALGGESLDDDYARLLLTADLSDRDTVEHVRNEVWAPSGGGDVWEIESAQVSEDLARVQAGMLIGASGVMALIAASMLVTTLEQLRERKQLLSALVALGTPRATLGASVLWQTAVPVMVGLVLASVVGVLLGALLMSVVSLPLGSWLAFLPMAGVGAGIIGVVTLGSMPMLWRLMRPDGLRVE